MDIAAVILNYNDAPETIKAIKRMAEISAISYIIVVDNASTDDSAVSLRDALAGGDFAHGVTLLKAPRNGGYGSGNNLGVRYAFEKLGAKYCLIANPDSVFDEALTLRMRGVFDEDLSAACAGAVMTQEGSGTDFTYCEYKLSAWKERSFSGEIINSGPLLRRVFGRLINYSPAYYESAAGKLKVFAVHGSLIMVDAAKFLDSGGFDEEIFLYAEENILARRLKNKGFTTYLIKMGYLHGGSHSITGSGLDAVARQRLREASELVYYKKYLGAGPVRLAAARLIGAVVILETRIFL